jgi:hypothetical protein
MLLEELELPVPAHGKFNYSVLLPMNVDKLLVGDFDSFVTANDFIGRVSWQYHLITISQNLSNAYELV